MNYQTIQKSKIFQEFSLEKSEYWFTYQRSKFINHIDTLYFVIYPMSWADNPNKIDLCDYLKAAKVITNECGESQPLFENLFDGLEVKPYFGFQMYDLHFGKQDCFDIFICENPPTPNTPPIFVQLRSQFLWLLGSKNAFDVACDCVEAVLESYDIEILKVQENRVDYAFHTNYIQDLINFFPEHYLKEMQISNFERWHKEGNFVDDDVFCDYFTLGRRKSNNVFFRVYNKTKEVIEMGYKQFFVPLWQSEGLISLFDKFVLEKCFTYGTYESKEKARCEFYLSYGNNPAIKIDIMQLLDNPDTPMKNYKKLADGLVPDLTVISNVEFQTKRKFYDRLDIARITKDTSHKANIYNLLECYYSIINKLTYDNIRFIKYKGFVDVPRPKRPLADWWQRLRSSKSVDFESDEQFVMMVREYQFNLDTERRKNVALSGIASTAAYLSRCKNSPFENDLYDMIASLNDNDISFYYRKKSKRIKDLKQKGLIDDE